MQKYKITPKRYAATEAQITYHIAKNQCVLRTAHNYDIYERW